MPDYKPTLELYKASAGSGKTYQLALKYICLLLGERIDNDGHIRLYEPGERTMYREILAITFTNKATNEMKQRIISELDRLADVGKPSAYRSVLTKLTGASEAKLADAANAALTAMLYDYGKMQVSTIDSFFQRVLRSFAYEADLGGNYELSLDDEEIINNAIADTLTQVCGIKSKHALRDVRVARIRKWVEQIIHNQYSNADDVRVFDKNNAARTALAKFIKALNNETYKANAEKLAPFFADPNGIDNLIDALRRKLNDVKALIDADVAALDFSKINKRNHPMILNTAEARPPVLKGSIIDYAGGTKDTTAIITKDHKNDSALVDRLHVWAGHVSIYWTIRTMLDQMYNLGLFHEVLDVAERMKVHLNTILLSDTNTMLNYIIGGSDTPFIYERIGERLHHFLIDEFQDTSMLQWENLSPLVGNSLSSGYDNMIIGDVKQCIYRFRNSFPGLLDHELQSDPMLGGYIEQKPIDTNWRSSVDVVEFNNMLFNNIRKHPTLSGYGLTSYASVAQKCAPHAGRGYVDVASAADFDNVAIKRMVEHMARQLASGYKPADIVILVRKHVMGAKVLNALAEYTEPGRELEGINIVSGESLYIKNSYAVRYILAQLRELERIWTPGEKVDAPKKTSIKSRATDRDLDWIQEQLRLATDRGLTPDAAIEAVMDSFDKQSRNVGITPLDQQTWRERMRGRALFEIVEELIDRLPEPEWRKTEAQYITAFQDLVSDYCRHNAPSIHGFLRHWDDKLVDKAAVGLADGANAIRIATIHASKGLEFNCVHLLINKAAFDSEEDYRWYAASNVFSQLGITVNKPHLFPIKSAEILGATLFAPDYRKLQAAQFLDELNSLYVAMTRAKTELIATFEAGGEDKVCAASVVRDGLGQTGRDWVYTQGTPTVKTPETIKPSETEILEIKQYDVFDRLDTWHSTRVSDEEE